MASELRLRSNVRYRTIKVRYRTIGVPYRTFLPRQTLPSGGLMLQEGAVGGHSLETKVAEDQPTGQFTRTAAAGVTATVWHPPRHPAQDDLFLVEWQLPVAHVRRTAMTDRARD